MLVAAQGTTRQFTQIVITMGDVLHLLRSLHWQYLRHDGEAGHHPCISSAAAGHLGAWLSVEHKQTIANMASG